MSIGSLVDAAVWWKQWSTGRYCKIFIFQISMNYSLQLGERWASLHIQHTSFVWVGRFQNQLQGTLLSVYPGSFTSSMEFEINSVPGSHKYLRFTYSNCPFLEIGDYKLLAFVS